MRPARALAHSERLRTVAARARLLRHQGSADS
jgi:hypothetical protein